MLIYFILYHALGHSPRGSVAYAGVDATTGEMVAIIEWSFKLKPKNSKKLASHDTDADSSDLTNYMKQVVPQLSIGLLHPCA
jgi:hypothetical protein